MLETHAHKKFDFQHYRETKMSHIINLVPRAILKKWKKKIKNFFRLALIAKRCAGVEVEKL